MLTSYATLHRQVSAMERDLRQLRLTREASIQPRRTPVDIAAALSIGLDGWQRDALTTDKRDILLLVSRQGGKGLVAAMLALTALIEDAGSTTIIISKTERQAKRLMRRIRRYYHTLANVPPILTEGQLTMELRNGAEILALPGSEENIRGIESVDLLIADEAALVPDSLFFSVRPMLAVSRGRSISLTTPRGRRGWFFHEFTGNSDTYHRVKVTAHDIPRIDHAWLEEERNRIGDWWFSQEFLCEFLDTDDQLFASEYVDAALVAGAGPLALPMFTGRSVT